MEIADSVSRGSGNGADIKNLFFPGVGSADGDVPGLFRGRGFADTKLKNIRAGDATLDPDADVAIEGNVDGGGEGASDKGIGGIGKSDSIWGGGGARAIPGGIVTTDSADRAIAAATATHADITRGAYTRSDPCTPSASIGSTGTANSGDGSDS